MNISVFHWKTLPGEQYFVKLQRIFHFWMIRIPTLKNKEIPLLFHYFSIGKNPKFPGYFILENGTFWIGLKQQQNIFNKRRVLKTKRTTVHINTFLDNFQISICLSRALFSLSISSSLAAKDWLTEFLCNTDIRILALPQVFVFFPVETDVLF